MQAGIVEHCTAWYAQTRSLGRKHVLPVPWQWNGDPLGLQNLASGTAYHNTIAALIAVVVGNAALDVVETLLVNGHPTTRLTATVLAKRVVGHGEHLLEGSLAASFAPLVHTSQYKFVLAE